LDREIVMPIKPPTLTATDLDGLRLQVNEAISELSSYIESIIGVDGKQFKLQNSIDFNGHNTEIPDKDYVDERTKSYKTIACPDGTNPVADSHDDTLTLKAGTGVSIVGDALNDTVTIEISGESGFVTGPAVSRIHTVPRFKTTLGNALEGSLFYVDDSGNILDTDGNIVLSFIPDTPGSVNSFAIQASHAGYPPIFYAVGSDPSVGILFQAKGDAKHAEFWGGGAQYNGARLILCGRDRATNPGNAGLDFGGYDGVGNILIRHRGTSGFVTVLTGTYDGKFTFIEDINTAAGKKFLVGGAQHLHDGADVTTGTIDGDRLPAISTTKKGAVPLTGTPSGKYLKDDGNWTTLPASSGDMVGPASSVDNTVPRFDGTTGKLTQGSGVKIDDNDGITLPGMLIQKFVLLATDQTYNVAATDYSIVTTAAAYTTVNLPASSGSGRILAISCHSTGSTTIGMNGADTLDGAGTSTLLNPTRSRIIQDCAAGVWYSLSRY
jgi:hypothetical protein